MFREYSEKVIGSKGFKNSSDSSLLCILKNVYKTEIDEILDDPYGKKLDDDIACVRLKLLSLERR